MEQIDFVQEYFKIIYYFYQLKKYITYFGSTIQIDSWKSNGISEKYNENIAKSESNFATTFVDHHL